MRKYVTITTCVNQLKGIVGNPNARYVKLTKHIVILQPLV